MNPLHDIDADRLDEWRSQPPKQRLKDALERMYVARLLLIDAMRLRHPELTEAEACERVVQEVLAE